MVKRIKVGIIATCLIVISCSLAHATWNQEHEITDFSKLLSSHINPYLVPNGAAVEARNLRANVTFGELTKRSSMDTYVACGAYKVTGLHRYYKTNGDQFVICSGSTFLNSDKNDAKVFIEIRDELTDGARFDFETFKNKTIGCNGTDACQKYDGHVLTTANTDGARTASILTADLGASFAELDTGTDLDASSWYQYVIAHYDGTTYFYSDAVSNPILTGSSVHNIALTDVPLGPPGTTTRYIYRTDGNASRAAVESDTTYKLVGNIANNSATTFSDTTADGSVATPTWTTASGGTNVTPPIGKFILLSKSRIFIANKPNFTSDILWSYPYRADVFDPVDFEPIREDDGDVITFIENQSGVVVIGKTNTIMKLITLSGDDTQWQVLGPYSDVGCPTPYSVANTPKGIACVAKEGIYIFDGSNSQLISDITTDAVRDMLWTSRNDIAGIYFNNEYQVAYTSIVSGAGVNNRVLVFDMQRDAYEIDDKDINVFHVFSSGTDEGTLYSGDSGSGGAILAHTITPGGVLIYKTQTDFENGTYDDTDVFGSEPDPILRLSWNIAFDDSEFTGKGFDHANYATSTFARRDLDGTWTSPIIEINATNMDKLFWNEDLGPDGDITFAIKLAATSGGIAGASYSSEFSDPSGSDISGETANNFAQLRASLSTTDITKTPDLVRRNNFSIKMVYSKEGVASETSIPTVWKSGAMDFGNPKQMKMLWGIIIYYTGTSGTLAFQITDMEGDVDKSFSIDLSVDPSDDTDDEYTGTATGKKFTHTFEYDGTVPQAEFYQITITESAVIPWSIQRATIRYNLQKVTK